MESAAHATMTNPTSMECFIRHVIHPLVALATKLIWRRDSSELHVTKSSQNLPIHSFPIATEAVCDQCGSAPWHGTPPGDVRWVEALSRSSWSYQRLASLTAVQGLCQAPTTGRGMRQLRWAGPGASVGVTG